MSRDDEVGAVAAAEYFLELYTYTESTQDTERWQAMSHPDCSFCRNVVDGVSARKAARQVVKSAPMTVTNEAVEVLSTVAFSVSIDVTKEPEELWSTDGVLVGRDIDIGGRFVIVVLRNPAEWIIRAVTPMNPVTR